MKLIRTLRTLFVMNMLQILHSFPLKSITRIERCRTCNFAIQARNGRVINNCKRYSSRNTASRIGSWSRQQRQQGANSMRRRISLTSTSEFEAMTVPAGYKEVRERTTPSFRIYYNDIYEVKLPKGHRFPMDKYQKVRKRVQAEIQQLSQEEKDLVSCGMCE